MKAVFNDSSIPEKEAKRRYSFPENLMMENAASALQKQVEEFFDTNNLCAGKPSHTHKPLHAGGHTGGKVLILSGSGNNGADGLALARRIHGNFDVTVILFGSPKTSEAQLQFTMAQAVGVQIAQWDEGTVELINSADVIVDCIFGTGFHGELPSNIKSVLELANNSRAFKLACDIPSGLAFNADVTVTMGALKSILFSDNAKPVCGKIKVADLGISSLNFEKCGTPDAFLIEDCDIKLPFRTNKSAHKGTYGHTAVFAGQKSGAAIIAAEAALHFGSGLTTLVKTEDSNLEQFKISPELMISDEIPKNTTAILLGPGLGTPSKELLQKILDFSPAALVLDADMLTYSGLNDFFTQACTLKSTKIILTPHPKELSQICQNLQIGSYTPVQASAYRMEIAAKISQKFPNLTLIMKSANTFISTAEDTASSNKIFICDSGCQSLAKGGSGDVLAGMTASLLAQGYSAKEAAITAVKAHANASQNFSQGEGWDLSPQSLIAQLPCQI